MWNHDQLSEYWQYQYSIYIIIKLLLCQCVTEPGNSIQYVYIHVFHCFTHIVAACMKHWAWCQHQVKSYPDMQLGDHNTYLLDPSGRRAHTCTQSCIIILKNMATWSLTCRELVCWQLYRAAAFYGIYWHRPLLDYKMMKNLIQKEGMKR